MVYARQVFEVVRDRLAQYIGPHTARNAIKAFMSRENGARPEDISVHEALDLIPKFRPMLKVLLGAALCEQVLAKLTLELEFRK